MPRISLIMSTYNDAPYLPLALDSLLQQTYTDFELILIDDGASDETPQIVAQYDDKRLIYQRNPKNIGLARSLNRGLELANGDLIGRLDADDIATPTTRLADQVEFLDSHPEIGFLSGDMVSIGEGGEWLTNGQEHYGMIGTHGLLGWRLLWKNPISHITVLMRRSILAENIYDPTFNNAEDYELWARLFQTTRFYRSGAVWAYRRILSSSVSHSRLGHQMELTKRIMRREQKRCLDLEPDEAVLETLMNLIYEFGETPDVAGATDYLMQAYQTYLSRTDLTPLEQEQIQADMIVWLYRLGNRGSAFYPLRQLERISKRDFYSRRTLNQILDILWKNKVN